MRLVQRVDMHILLTQESLRLLGRLESPHNPDVEPASALLERVPGEFQFQAATGNSNRPRQYFFHRKSLMSATLLPDGSMGVAPFRPE